MAAEDWFDVDDHSIEEYSYGNNFDEDNYRPSVLGYTTFEHVALIHETDKAYLISYPVWLTEEWFPKSQVQYYVHEGVAKLIVPKWLCEKKYLNKYV